MKIPLVIAGEELLAGQTIRECLDPSRPGVVVGKYLQATAANATTAHGGDALHGHALALRELWSLTLREAQTQAFADAFFVIALCFALATVTVPLMRKIAVQGAPSRDAH